MHISRPVYHLAMVALFALVAQGCNKENGIDNEAILKKPYSLYAADNRGALYLINSRDSGRMIFPDDGFPIRTIVTSGDSSILFAKGNLFHSTDNGANFNFKNGTINNTYLTLIGFDIAEYLPWQPIMLKVPSHNRIYVGSTQGQGIIYSEDNGKTFVTDAAWDPGLTGGNISSFTQLKNGALFALDPVNNDLYKRDNKDDNWSEVLPGTTQTLPTTGAFYLSHFNDELIATDFIGGNGVYHSTDGVAWFQYTGLPNRRLYTTSAPFEQRLLVGTDSMGVYRLEGNNFVTANNGLETNTTVYAMAGKDDVYKNETKRTYIYLATNKGLYRSEDGGQNWTRYKVGWFTAIY